MTNAFLFGVPLALLAFIFAWLSTIIKDNDPLNTIMIILSLLTASSTLLLIANTASATSAPLIYTLLISTTAILLIFIFYITITFFVRLMEGIREKL